MSQFIRSYFRPMVSILEDLKHGDVIDTCFLTMLFILFGFALSALLVVVLPLYLIGSVLKRICG